MSKVLIVYYTTTGNTQMLAEAIAEGIEEAGSEAILKNVAETDVSEIREFDKIVLGCSASGTEELDDTEFEPYFEEALPELKGKSLALFGCYGWGDGEFMRTWEERVTEGEANLFEEGFTHLETPDQETLDKAKEFGQRFAKN